MHDLPKNSPTVILAIHQRLDDELSLEPTNLAICVYPRDQPYDNRRVSIMLEGRCTEMVVSLAQLRQTLTYFASL